jgi:hypothetical protein
VTNEGNVVPWLMGTDVVIHNGCTTGVEAYVMGIPAVSYRAKINEKYDLGFYRLPNLISHQCFDTQQLLDTLAMILNGELGAANGDERRALVNNYLAAQEGPLACERIVDVLVKIVEDRPYLPKPALVDLVLGRSFSYWRRAIKNIKKKFDDKQAPPEFHRHRYPGISLQELIERISKIQRVLGDTTEISAKQISDQIFEIHR